MEASTGNCHEIDLDCLENEGENSRLQSLELESPDSGKRWSLGLDQQFHPMTALEILRETVRILRYNASGFMMIAAVLICPVSAVFLSNVLVNRSFEKRLTIRLLLMTRFTGLPLKPFIKQLCQRFSEMAISATFCFPVYVTFLLASKAATVYGVDCTYSRKKFLVSEFYIIIIKIWRHLVMTYLWVCMVIVGCLFLFLGLLIAVCNVFTFLGFPFNMILYPAMMVGLIFSVIFANAIVICNLAIVISVLEYISGLQTLIRSKVLMKGQTQVALVIFIGSTMGMAFVEWLFKHRVKTLSYGDGSSRIWEGPLLVIMYSFVVLIDSMMNAVFYFTCRFSNVETSDGECHSFEEGLGVSSGSVNS